MSLNTTDEGYNNGKKYGQKGTICGPNTYINLWFCNNISSSVVGEQGYVILIQTRAELMFCHSFCFSIYRHFVPSFVYHSVYGLVLLCYLTQIQVI